MEKTCALWFAELARPVHVFVVRSLCLPCIGNISRCLVSVLDAGSFSSCVRRASPHPSAANSDRIPFVLFFARSEAAAKHCRLASECQGHRNSGSHYQTAREPVAAGTWRSLALGTWPRAPDPRWALRCAWHRLQGTSKYDGIQLQWGWHSAAHTVRIHKTSQILSHEGFSCRKFCSG